MCFRIKTANIEAANKFRYDQVHASGKYFQLSLNKNQLRRFKLKLSLYIKLYDGGSGRKLNDSSTLNHL